MNGFKLLTIEYDGIYGIINDYTSDSKVINYLLKLKEGIDNLDYDVVVYSLEELINGNGNEDTGNSKYNYGKGD